MSGLHHATTLLLTQRLRALPHDGSPALVAEVLVRMARDLAALADDMRAPADEAEWLIKEYGGAVDRVAHLVSHRGDGDFQHVLETARTRGADILRDVGRHRAPDAGRDLFLMHLAEDRLPIAAPLAVELTKRRFTVAFSDYEVSTLDQLYECRQRGLQRHGAGIFLNTPAVSRRGWALPPSSDRFLVIKPATPEASLDYVCSWITSVKRSLNS